jgi:hypothetical protein
MLVDKVVAGALEQQARALLGALRAAGEWLGRLGKRREEQRRAAFGGVPVDMFARVEDIIAVQTPRKAAAVLSWDETSLTFVSEHGRNLYRIQNKKKESRRRAAGTPRASPRCTDDTLVMDVGRGSENNSKIKRKVGWGDMATVRFYDPKSTTPLVEEIHQDVVVKVDRESIDHLLIFR